MALQGAISLQSNSLLRPIADAALEAKFAADCAEESVLIRRTLSGDRDAFGELALKCEPALFRHIGRIVQNRDDVEELAQEALLRAYRNLSSYRPKVPFRFWLLRIASNLAIDHLRKTKPPNKSLDEVLNTSFEPVSPGPDASEHAQTAETARAVQVAISDLPRLTRAALNLRYAEEMSIAEIAVTLDKSATAVKVLLHRARNKVRDVLQNRNVLNAPIQPITTERGEKR